MLPKSSVSILKQCQGMKTKVWHFTAPVIRLLMYVNADTVTVLMKWAPLVICLKPLASSDSAVTHNLMTELSSQACYNPCLQHRKLHLIKEDRRWLPGAPRHRHLEGPPGHTCPCTHICKCTYAVLSPTSSPRRNAVSKHVYSTANVDKYGGHNSQRNIWKCCYKHWTYGPCTDHTHQQHTC